MATKKLYIRMANTVRWFLEDTEDDPEVVPTVEALVTRLCVDLQDDNPRFDKVRFMEACGL